MVEKELTLEEKWEQATIADNFIFYKVMRNNPDVCKRLLEILLEFPIEKIEMQQEEEIDIDYGSRGIRLDVFAKNDGQAFNIEMQSIDTKELPERARYYQGVIDVDMLKSGQKYKELKDSYIIFICVHDIFGKGLAKYTFENLCRENYSIKLNDRTVKLFFCAKNCDILLNEEQKAFLKLITSNESSDTFSSRISLLVAEAKHNIQWKRQYMDFAREKTYAFEDGMEKARIEDIKNFFMNGASVELIAKSTGMTIEQIEEITKDVAVVSEA
ncbi:MAG: Rpn family recombination-promoting nuclease/putative transposase [Treponema sp.]|nr:Rpn family recombination-promoting nuclease/putative transposase [Treponema sp.]